MPSVSEMREITSSLALSAILAAQVLSASVGRGEVPEARGVWFNSYREPFASLDGETFRLRVRQMMAQLSDAGINMIFYLVKTPWDARAYYDSSLMERVTDEYDPLKVVVEEGTAAGLEVHAYFNVLAEGDSSLAGMLKVRREWALVDPDGHPTGWMNPFDEGVGQYVVAIAQELAHYEGLAGIQLDRIRFPGSRYGYNPDVLELYRNVTGKSPASDADPEWVRFRAEGVTPLVRLIREEIKRVDPSKFVSASVFPDKYSALAGVMQDWETWARLGYVDFLATMSYTDSTSRLETYVREQLQAVNLSVPLYVGTSVETATDGLFADLVSLIRRSPANGFVIFNANILIESPGKMELLRGMFVGPRPVTPHSSEARWDASRAQSAERWKDYFKPLEAQLVLVFVALVVALLAAVGVKFWERLGEHSTERHREIQVIS